MDERVDGAAVAAGAAGAAGAPGGDRVAAALERIADAVASGEERERARPRREDVERAYQLFNSRSEKIAKRALGAAEGAGMGKLPSEYRGDAVWEYLEASDTCEELFERIERSLAEMGRLLAEYRAWEPDAVERALEAATEVLSEELGPLDEECAEMGVRLDLPTAIEEATEGEKAADSDDEKDAEERGRVEAAREDARERAEVLLGALRRAFAPYQRAASDGGMLTALASGEATDHEDMTCSEVIDTLDDVCARPYFGILDDPTPFVRTFWVGFHKMGEALGLLCPISERMVKVHVWRVLNLCTVRFWTARRRYA